MPLITKENASYYQELIRQARIRKKEQLERAKLLAIQTQSAPEATKLQLQLIAKAINELLESKTRSRNQVEILALLIRCQDTLIVSRMRLAGSRNARQDFTAPRPLNEVQEPARIGARYGASVP